MARRDRPRAGLGAAVGEEAEARAAEFEAARLTAAGVLEPERAAPIETSVSAPEALFEDEAAGRVEVEGSPGGPAWRRRLAPRQPRRGAALLRRRGPFRGIAPDA